MNLINGDYQKIMFVFLNTFLGSLLVRNSAATFWAACEALGFLRRDSAAIFWAACEALGFLRRDSAATFWAACEARLLGSDLVATFWTACEALGLLVGTFC